MLEELIRLSEELFEMELVKESVEIDGLIHKLYGIGGDTGGSLPGDLLEDDIVSYSSKDSSEEELKSLLLATKDENFRENISDILIESLDVVKNEGEIKNATYGALQV